MNGNGDSDLQDINDEISALMELNDGLRAEIVDINNEIARIKGNKEISKPAPNNMFDSKQLKLDKLNDEHKAILLSKADSINPLRNQYNSLRSQNDALVEQSQIIRFEIEEHQIESADIIEKSRKGSAEIESTIKETDEIKKQTAEIQTQAKAQNAIFKEAEKALEELKSREEALITHDGGKESKKRMYNSTIREIEDSEHEILATKRVISDLQENEKKLQEDTEKKLGELGISVNWVAEKEDLLLELRNARLELSKRKGGVSSKERQNSSAMSHFSKCSPFIEKWKQSLDTMELPSESLGELLSALESKKAENEKSEKSLKDRLALMIVSNLKLEDELNRRRASFDRTAEQLYSDGVIALKTAEERRKQSQLEVRKITKMIGERKLALASSIWFKEVA